MDYHLIERIFAGLIGIGLIIFIILYIKNTRKTLYGHLLKKYDDAINKLQIHGRDEFYTHLIIQEHPFWFNQIAEGKLIEQTEIDWLINRRGFNQEESGKLKSMANFMNVNNKLIKQINSLKPDKK